MKIHHALKETSYLSDAVSMTVSGGMAITIGDYLSVPAGEKKLSERVEFIFWKTFFNQPQ